MDQRSRNRGGKPQGACRDFQRRGRCRFGDRCKYSHTATTETVHQTAPKSYRPPNNAEFIGYLGDSDGDNRVDNDDGDYSAVAKLREWKQLLNHGTHDENLNIFGCAADSKTVNQGDLPKYVLVSRFFGLGLELVDGDISALQQMIPLLVTDDGLDFIKAAIDQHIQDATTPAAKVDLLSQQILPFLRIITHSRLTASNLLEGEVTNLYTFLVGTDSSRVLKLSAFVLDLAAMWETLPVRDLNLMSVVEVLLSALRKAIDCSTTNIVNAFFQNTVGRLSHLIKASTGSGADFWRTKALKHLNYLQRRIEVLASTTTAPDAKAPPVRGPNFPGNLCENGPRHDNDHEDICMIRILPTAGELDATRSDYLPTNKSSDWHISGIRGRLDREFRLLRENTVGQLRDEVRRVRELIRTSGNKGGQTATFRYGDAAVETVGFEKLDGFEFTLRCKQPANVQHMGDAAREQWWETCKRLQSGHLVCVLDSGFVQFFVVSDSTVRSNGTGSTDKTQNPDHRVSGRRGNGGEDGDAGFLRLSHSREHLYVKLNLIETSPDDVAIALRWLQADGSSRQRYLVEFPQALLASFIHTLKALQHLSHKSDLPFIELIAPEEPTSEGEVHVPAPVFSQAPDFAYDLSCLTHDKQPFTVKLDRLPTPAEVSSRTGLDLTQSEALLSTLSRELSLIQGPPGTGKSYTGKKIIQALLANRAKAELGPIICVCYTNHALDQLLEHLLDNGIKNIIRIGGQSKSERLQDHSLNALVRSSKKTAVEKGYAMEAMSKITILTGEINAKLDGLARCESAESIVAYLRSSHPAHFTELFPTQVNVDGEGGSQEHAVILRWLRGGKKFPPHVRALPVLVAATLSSMTQYERRHVFNTWLVAIRDPIVTELLQLQAAYNQAKNLHEQIRREVRHRCLEGADIIGMTTSGGARELSLLRKLSSKVLVCEEAGEVLESHILTSLLPSVQHAILIGDHLQLRPQINNFDLQSTNPDGAKYSLDMSLFERLVSPPHSSDHKVPFSTLQTQRRMHPCIADMVRSTLYSKLQDGDNVTEYPEVVGMGRRLFWFDHGHHEDRGMSAGSDSTSRSNQFEVEMAATLVSHIVRQGEYRPQDIAVLTPYSGQLQKLRYRLEKESSFTVDIVERDVSALPELAEPRSGDAARPENQLLSKRTLFDSLRLATVDNFQGEEAKIVIISLVRSNRERVCGFLKTSNRINVLLSRAKHGCYIIGDAQTYGPVPMWNQVIKLLKAGGNLGNALQLKCSRHPGATMSVMDPTDFARLSPDGGCSAPCGKPLECGHACYGSCHSDMLHKATFCHQKCTRAKQGCDHICREECGVDCENDCNVVLENILVQLPCGHTLQSPTCWQAQRPAAVKCDHEVERTIPECGHAIRLACHVDVTSTKMTCSSACGEILKCGHACPLPCHQCLKPEKDTTMLVRKCRGTCEQVCGRQREGCSHPCPRPCHRSSGCGPCQQPCEIRCSHSVCPRLCHETCVPCAEDGCASHCPHSKCTMPCAVACDWVPCSKRCALPLSCGHRCPSLCGEACPEVKYCQQCGSQDVLSTIVEYVNMSEYKVIDLNKNPCIFADCGHILTRSCLDEYMAVAEYYVLDKYKSPTSVKRVLKPFSMDGVEAKSCPQCRGSLRNISRYGRIIRPALLDVATKRIIQWSEAKHLELAKRLLQEQQRLKEDVSRRNDGDARPLQHASSKETKMQLTDSDFDQFSTINALSGTNRYDGIIKIYGDLIAYHDKVRTEGQPYYKIANFFKRAHDLNLANWSKASGPFVLGASVVQPRGYLLASALVLKCSVILLSDIMTFWTANLNTTTGVQFNITQCTTLCGDLISLAQQTNRTQLEAEGHVYAATFCALASSSHRRQLCFRVATEEPDLKQYHAHIREARKLLHSGDKWAAPNKSIIGAGIRAAESVFTTDTQPYRAVSISDSRAVYDNMVWDFPQGPGGYWYVCLRGHPFTIGYPTEEEVQCPECGAPVSEPSNPAPLESKFVTVGEKLAAGVAGLRM